MVRRHPARRPVLLSLCLLILPSATPLDRPIAADLVVETNFAGGSAHLISVDQTHRIVRINPAAHTGRGWLCWWYFKLSGIQPGESVTIDVGDAPWATPDRAAFSVDNRTWLQTSAGIRTGPRIAYRQAIDARQAWFAWGPPFVPEQASQLVAWVARKCPQAHAIELCRTRAGRPVPALTFKPAGPEPPLGIWIQARQHAWESGSSWVCRGLVEWLASDDPRAVSLRNRARITVVPIMDVDSAAIGAGGKNQLPHDHNRDWSGNPHWPSVQSAITQIKQWNAANQFDMFIDLHNPGANSRHPFFFVSPRPLLSQTGQANLDRFLTICKLEMTGPLSFEGETHESGSSYDKDWKTISKNWVTFNASEHVVSLTLETPWNTPHSTTGGYRTVGRQLGQSIERFFRRRRVEAE